MATRIHPTRSLEKEDSGEKIDKEKTYRGMIGSLLYLTASKPDIMFSVWVCARFQVDPRKSHLTTVKRILRHLKGTTSLTVFYKKSPKYKLSGCCDSDYAGDSTSDNCTFLGDNLICWSSNRQNTIAMSNNRGW
uniref:Uncharacterized protein LOC113783987 n=1 Tax=Cicer arietinum TaxID=3827 RepID=A0A3Q7XHX2_CICAR